MPIHDWTRVDAGLFHAFHQAWITELCRALNSGALPADYFALPEQRVRGPIPDVLTLAMECLDRGPAEDTGTTALAVAEAPPRVHLVERCEDTIYVRRADRVAVRHRHGEVVAIIEIMSPGNKATDAEFRAFVKKAADLLVQGVHAMIVDLLPPTPRDPWGIHRAIWAELVGEDRARDQRKSLTLASYDAGPPYVAYVETVNVGDTLPAMPLFLRPEHYVPAPLERSYEAAWEVFPRALRGLLEAR